MSEAVKTSYETDLYGQEHRLGFLAVHERLLNNDPLAHVKKLMEADNPHEHEAQIYAEFKSDIGERSGNETPERHFYKSWDYRLESNDFISDTGLSLRELLAKGQQAAWNDYRSDTRFKYHLDRANAQAMHPDMLLEWRKSGDRRCVRLASLCPEETEVSTGIAKLGNFKPDRLMASVWIFEPTADGMRLHAFSQDQLTLDGLKENDELLGVEASRYSSSLDKLGELDYLPFTDGMTAVQAHKQAHDNRLASKTGHTHHFGIKNPRTQEESITAVENKPEAWELYWKAVNEVAVSLNAGATSPGLAELVLGLRSSYGPDSIPSALQIEWQRGLSYEKAGEFIEYLRERAIPQYVFGQPETYQAQVVYSGGAHHKIGAAGAYAVQNNIRHEGGCPSSPQSSQQSTSNAEMASALKVHGSEEFKSKWCPNCLKEPKAGKTVQAYRKGEIIGCRDCGVQIEACSGKVVKKGKNTLQRTAAKVANTKIMKKVVSANKAKAEKPPEPLRLRLLI